MIRPATRSDVDAIAALSSERRRVYESFEPRFWRVAEDADARHRPWLEFLVRDDSVVSLVAEIDGAFAGFVIATVGPAPPVVVVCGHRDEAKRSALPRAGLSLASEWYTGPTEGE